jgi:Na+/proline symporter
MHIYKLLEKCLGTLFIVIVCCILCFYLSAVFLIPLVVQQETVQFNKTATAADFFDERASKDSLKYLFAIGSIPLGVILGGILSHFMLRSKKERTESEIPE